jgi:hypothetical protein
VVEPADFVDASLAWCDAPTLRKITRDNAAELLRVSIP